MGPARVDIHFEIVGGTDVAEFAGKLYLPDLTAILENYMESLAVKLVRVAVGVFCLLTVAMCPFSKWSRQSLSSVTGTRLIRT